MGVFGSALGLWLFAACIHFLTWAPFPRFLLSCCNVVLRVLQFRHARFSRCWYMDGQCATEDVMTLVVNLLAVNFSVPGNKVAKFTNIIHALCSVSECRLHSQNLPLRELTRFDRCFFEVRPFLSRRSAPSSFRSSVTESARAHSYISS